MDRFLVRVFLMESNWNDIEISARTIFDAERIGKGMSPIGRASALQRIVEW